MALSAVVSALESYASDNGNYTVSGFGAGGNGQGWFHRQAGNYPQSIYSALIEYLPDVPSDPLHLDTSSPSSDDFLVYRCEDRIAVFSLSDGIQPSSQDTDWWETNGCTTLPITRFNHSYFQVSDSLENVIDTPVTDNPANTAPAAVDDTATVVAGVKAIIEVLVNDLDEDVLIDASTVTVAIVTGSEPSVGTAVVQEDSTILYSAPADTQETSDSFSYSVTDAQGASAQATVTITIDPANTAPVAEDDAVIVIAGVESPIDVLTNDLDDGEVIDASAVTVAIVEGSEPSVGTTVVQDDGTILYSTPADTQETSDSFSYSVMDAQGESTEATVTITIDPANTAPVTEDDAVTVVAGVESSIDVLANDLDDGEVIDASAVTVEIVEGSEPSVGATVVQDDGTILYSTPANTQETSDSFSYSVTDAQGESAEATVTITIDPANTAPVAEDDAVTVIAGVESPIEVLANDLDEGAAIEAESVTITIVAGSEPSVGTAVVQDDGTILYSAPADTHETSDSFSYSVMDAQGESAEATVTITIDPANTAPVAEDDAATVVAGAESPIEVLANDLDDGEVIDASAVTVAIVAGTEPSAGTAVVQDDSAILYSAPADTQETSDSFSYSVTDAQGASAQATVTITITIDPANTAPVAEDDAVTVIAGVESPIDVLANDLDDGEVIDASTVTVAIVAGTEPSVGTAVVQDDGTILYSVPADTQETSDSFSYSVTDAQGESAEATVTITIDPANTCLLYTSPSPRD